MDTEERTVDIPADFQKALDKNSAAKKAFERLSNSMKKALTLPITNGKKEATRNRNIGKAITSLLRTH